MLFKRNSSAGNKISLMKGNQARDNQLWSQAVAAYEDYLFAMPEHFDVWKQLGNCAKEAGQFERAILAYDRAADLNPNDGDLHLQRGHLFKVMRRRGEAVEAYEATLRIEPSCVDALTELRALRGESANGFSLPITWVDFVRADRPEDLAKIALEEQRYPDPFSAYSKIIFQ